MSMSFLCLCPTARLTPLMCCTRSAPVPRSFPALVCPARSLSGPGSFVAYSFWAGSGSAAVVLCAGASHDGGLPLCVSNIVHIVVVVDVVVDVDDVVDDVVVVVVVDDDVVVVVVLLFC